MSYQEQAELTAEDIRTLFIFGEVTVGEITVTLARGAIKSALQTVVEMVTYPHDASNQEIKSPSDIDYRKWSDDQ